VEAGKLADLVILDADPLADVANLSRIHRVIKDGRSVPLSPRSAAGKGVRSLFPRKRDLTP